MHVAQIIYFRPITYYIIFVIIILISVVIILLAFFIAIIVAGFQYLYKNKKRGQLNYWLFSLRFISIFSILIYLINPTFKKSKLRVEKPTLIVAVDNSKSILNSGKEDKVVSVINELKINESLNNKFDVTYFTFGENLKRNGNLNFSESFSNLSKPFGIVLF